jgi:hypothetical protein
MTDYAADAPTSAGVTVTQRTGTASSDTVPAGCVLLVQNTGAGSHNFDLTINASYDGLGVNTAAIGNATGVRRHVIANGAFRLVRVPPGYGDANGRVAVAIDGTPTEVKYTVIGA